MALRSGKKCAILCNGLVSSYDWLKVQLTDYEYIVAADGGHLHLEKIGVVADLLLGDGDSLTGFPETVKKVIYPPKKDKSDLQLAIEKCLSAGYEYCYLYGALGKRKDHEFFNIMLLPLYRGHCSIISKQCTVLFSCPEQPVHRRGNIGETVSLFPCTADTICSTTGLKYSLSHQHLKEGTHGLSNEIIMDDFSVTVHCGEVLLFHNHLK